MELILYFIYLYVIIYTVYFLILAIRNLKDTPFHIERKYSKYDEVKEQFCSYNIQP